MLYETDNMIIGTITVKQKNNETVYNRSVNNMSAGGGVSDNWSREQILKLNGEAVWLPHGRHADRLFERVAVPREHGKKGVNG